MSKKNLSLRQRNFDNDILGYRLPVFHGDGKKVYVDFYAFDPARDELRRKKIHLDKIKSKIGQKRHASLLIHTLTQKLLSGWNPWCDASTSRGYTPIDIIIENYIDIEVNLPTGICLAKDLEHPNTHRSNNCCGNLLEY